MISLNKTMGINVPTSTFEHVTNSTPSFTTRMTNLWSLDFDACGSVTMDQDRVDLAFDFGNRNLAAAKETLHQRDEILPLEFLTRGSKLLNPQLIHQLATS